jgi:peptidoglycan/LPS O-acetylase OafA/YrhL
VSFSRFYLRRSLRIFPAFYAYSAGVLTILLLAGKRIVWPQTFASLLYVNNYYQALHGDPNTAFSHTWSLAVEEQFYLLWPLLFSLLAWRPRTLGRVLAAIIAAVWVRRWLLVAHGGSVGYLYEAFDARADHLLVGCLLAVALWNGWAGPLWRRLCASAAAPLLTIAALAISSAAAYRVEHYRDIVGFVIDPLLVAALLVQLIALADAPGWRLANTRPLHYLGRISYSVYLYQQILSGIVESALRGQPFAVQFVAYLAGVTLVASASYFVIERPFLLLKDRIGRRAHGAAAREVQLAPSPS